MSTWPAAASMSAAPTPTSAATSCSAALSLTSHGRSRSLASELSELAERKKAEDLLFTTSSGSPLRLPNWRCDTFHPARSRAGISGQLRVHDLRHTAASLMIQPAYPPKILQEIMGHASITTTLDLYGHIYPGDMDRYADRLDTAIEEASTAKIRPNETSEGEADEASGH